MRVRRFRVVELTIILQRRKQPTSTSPSPSAVSFDAIWGSVKKARTWRGGALLLLLLNTYYTYLKIIRSCIQGTWYCLPYRHFHRSRYCVLSTPSTLPSLLFTPFPVFFDSRQFQFYCDVLYTSVTSGTCKVCGLQTRKVACPSETG